MIAPPSLPPLHDALQAALVSGLPLLGGALVVDPMAESPYYRIARVDRDAYFAHGHYPWLGDVPTFLIYVRWSIDRLGIYSGLTTGQTPLAISIELAAGLRRHLLDLGDGALRLPYGEDISRHVVVELASILWNIAEAIGKADAKRGWA